MRVVCSLTFLLFGVLVGLAAAEDYCSFHPNHALCGNTGVGPQCTQLLEQGLSEDEVKKIVKIHNEMRVKVAKGHESRGASGPQPGASNMEQMLWDEELHRMAQSHANKCVFAHDCGDCRKSSRFGVGQNIHESSSTADVPRPELKAAVTSFYDEVADFDSASVSSYHFVRATGHYTQIVWANTNRIGCGYVKYKEGIWYKKLLTCNYGPSGNVVGRPIYKIGESCSSCPKGSSCSADFPGLCKDDGIGGASNLATLTTSDPRTQAIAVLVFLHFLLN